MSQSVRKRILLVEDEPLIAMTEKVQLEQYGYAVRTVTTGEKAVEAVQTASDIDLILMDINLGSGIDGTQAAEIILKDQDIPIIFLSSHTDPEIVEKTEKITSYGYVVKNSSATVLDASIKMAFKLFDATKERNETVRLMEKTNEHVPGAVYQFKMQSDGTACFPFSTHGMWDIFELTPEQLQEDADMLSERTHPDDLQRVIDSVQESYSRLEPWECELRVVLPERGERWIRGTANPEATEDGVLWHGYLSDITERKRAEEALHQERNLLLSIIDSIPDLIYVKDTEARKQIANTADCHSCGFDSKEDLIGKDDFEIFPAEIARSFFEDDQKVLNYGERVVNREEKTIMPNGEIGWQLTTKLPMYDQHGQITGLVGIGRDITNHKQAEEALRESEQRLRQVIDLVPHFVFAKDVDGTYLLANAAIAEAYGTIPEELVGKSDYDFTSNTEETDFFLQCDRQVIESGTGLFGIKEHLTDATGTRRYVETTKIPFTVSGAETPAILAVSVDITERKRIEDALNESMRRYSDLVAQIPVGVYIVWIRANGHIEFEYVSDRWCAIHGVRREDVMKDAATVNDLVHPDDRESFVKINRDAANEAKPFAWEGRFFTGEGQLRSLHIESTPRLHENGDIRWFGVTQDITDRKQAEEKITKQLTEKETLLREVHHRVKNNMATIESLLSLQAGSTVHAEAKTVSVR